MPSNMRCKVCGGWDGEFGHAKGVGPMCRDCYTKKYGRPYTEHDTSLEKSE